MGSLIVLVLLALAAVVGAFLIVYNIVGPRRDSLTRAERKDYERLVELRESLTNSAAEHIAYGDPYAAIVADEVRASRPRSREL